MNYENRSTESLISEFLNEKNMHNAASVDFVGDLKRDLILTFDDELTSSFFGRDAAVLGGISSFDFPRFEPSEESGCWPSTKPATNACGIIFADFDNDGDLDFYSPNPDGHQLFENQAGQYVDVTESMGLNVNPPGQLNNFTINGSWGDFDGDSFVDLLIVYGPDPAYGSTNLVIWRNEGGTGFVDASFEHVIAFSGETRIVSAHWADFDLDNDLDLLLVQGEYHYSGTLINHSKYWENSGSISNYYLSTDQDKIDLVTGHFNKSWNLSVVKDMNNDGLLDVAYANVRDVGISCFNNDDPENSFFSDTVNNEHCDADCPRVWDLASFDADLDGINDLAMSGYEGPNHPLLFEGSLPSPGVPDLIQKQGLGFGPAHHDAQGMCASDFMQDGRTEIFLTQNTWHPNHLAFFWDIPNTGHDASWVGFKLKAPHGACNRAALGTTVILSAEMATGLHVQAQVVDGGSGRASQADFGLSFGLGEYTGSVDLKAVLPNRNDSREGTTIHLNQVPIDQYWTFDVDGIDDATPVATFYHELWTSTVTMIVTWKSFESSDSTADRVVFYVEGIPDALDPGRRVYTGGSDIEFDGEMFVHSLTITDLPCDVGLDYYFSVQSKSGDTYFGSSIHSDGPATCLSPPSPRVIPELE